MSDSNNDINHTVLNLSPDEKRAFAFLFNQADTDQLGVITGERAVSFFERTKVGPDVLGEIWQIADTDNRGFLSKPGFCMVLRLIGHYQAGKEPSSELAYKPGPVPKFEGLQIPGVTGASTAAQFSPSQGAFPPTALQPQNSGQGTIRIPPLDPQKLQQYSGLFERSGAQNGFLDGQSAKAIFERAGLPNEVLGRIWNLADREQRGVLDQTEFIVAMHLLTSMKTRTMTALPNTLPQGFYDAAARRGAPPPGTRQPTGPVARQFTGGSVGAPVRTQSPLARSSGYGSPQPVNAQIAGPAWLIAAPEKAKYDQFFSNLDPQGQGTISGEQAVGFFSDSGLSEDTLASIWDLADINSEGQLNRDEFAVAMYLIRQQRASNAGPLPAFLPPALIPPSMRKANLQQQTQQTTAPTFDNANNTSNLPKSAAEDLFGLDEPVSPPRAQQAQPAPPSTARDPFGSDVPASPTSPPRFQPPPPQQQQSSTMFKPFMPTSAFGASLAQHNTGGSQASAQGQPRAFPQQQAPKPQPDAMADLLGDDETNAQESNKISTDTTELANMSNQIGNLRNQMEQTQAKKSTTQADLNASSTQKRDLETRLQQFRSQYEQEVRSVKDLEQQLTTSRESTKKLGQELALLEGTYQDLQTQHQTVAQNLQADTTENARLKERIAQLNTEVSHLKPEIEKLKLDARQRKGMVSINKKQLATNEAERDRLHGEKADLEREAVEAAEKIKVASPEPTPTARDITSPAGSTLSATNPFFRKTNQEPALERSISPAAAAQPTASASTPSAFDQLFGPSFANTESTKSPPPTTSFGNRQASSGPAGITESLSSNGGPTPSATPPLSDFAKDSPRSAEPPPPPASRQFTPAQLPVGGLHERSAQDSEDADSTQVVPPASRAGDLAEDQEWSSPAPAATPAALAETLPGAFPHGPETPKPATEHISDPSAASHAPVPSSANDDFDSAFADFGASETSKAVDNERDPFAPSSSKEPTSQHHGFNSEFPPIETLEIDDDESDSEDEAPKGNSAALAAAPNNTREPATDTTLSAPERPELVSNKSAASILPPITAQTSPPSYEQSEHIDESSIDHRSGSNQFPKEFTGLLPAREDPTSPEAVATEPVAPKDDDDDDAKSAQTAHPSAFPPINTPISAAGTTATSEVFHDANSRPMSAVEPDSRGHPFGSYQNAGAATSQKNVFDEFDDFNDLAEAKEAEKTGSDFDFGFGGHSREASEFNPAFDSPAASNATTMASSHTPVAKSATFGNGDSNGFANFTPSASSTFGAGAGAGSGNSSIQQTPQGIQHDWDAIFSGLDSSASDKLDTSLNTNDPWATNGTQSDASGLGHSGAASSSQASKAKEMGRAITPGTEHDDPILKRLTGMGYARSDALKALEQYDYDINRAVDHLAAK